MSVRVRFAPSPTGALHIGGVRTALYNYLFARKHGGSFILRIEDTDQNRYVPGAEQYIIEALDWFGINPDEGVSANGPYGPYRQSERKEIYREYAERLVRNGKAYYAFDTPESLDNLRKQNDNFTYNHAVREQLDNSLTLPPESVAEKIDREEAWVIRLKVDPGREIPVRDLIRGDVTFQSDELDDKVLLKADGMPTYHLANIVDDHLMKITHVIRGEEWLPSTAHHVLLYEGLGWTDTMPAFAHLPLILKPVGNGKLSKRDGAKFGMPVFPLAWKGQTAEESFTGFRETGFLPEAALNFLALLGWHPSDDREIFRLDELVGAFSIDHIGKSGARFDFEKAKWFNQKYIQSLSNESLAERIKPYAEEKGYRVDGKYLQKAAELMKERVTFLPDFVESGYYLFEPVTLYDPEALQKKWKPELAEPLTLIHNLFEQAPVFEAGPLEDAVKSGMQENQIKPGDLLPLLRLALAGTMKGPAIFDMAELLGREETCRRIAAALDYFKQTQTA